MHYLALLSLLLLSGCVEGRWVHPEHTEDQTGQDWEDCKAEVLSGQEHNKETLAGGINLSGCMHAKGYRYVEDRLPQAEAAASTRR
ncbi:MAG: hypothetical protein H8K05_19285 [Nitrospira sp.]|nr:hypothetical protein [Nitrospira sp.]